MSEIVELEVLLVLRELPNGDTVAYPAGEPSWVAYGEDEEHVLTQQGSYLPKCLEELDAGVLPKLEYPADARIQSVEVALPWPGLPARLRREVPIALPCLVVPDPAGTWVRILPTDQVVHVLPEQSASERVHDEFLRLTAARALSPLELGRLMAECAPHRLHRLKVGVSRDNRDEVAARASERRQRRESRRKERARKLLAKVAEPLRDPKHPRKQAPVIAREREIAMLDALLRGKERMSLALVGPSLAGKTAVLQGWLDTRPGMEVHGTSGARLVAGQSGFGQLQERVRAVMSALEELDAVLYFDDYADLFAGEAGGIEDIANAMRPWLEQGRVRIVGEITPEELERHEKRHVGFFANLHRVSVAELDAARTIELLRERVAHDRRHEPHRPHLAAEAIEPLVELAERYFSYRAFPGKAVGFYDELRAIHESERDEEGKPPLLGVGKVYRAFSLRSGIPTFLLREEQAVRKREVESFFRRHLIGQDEAIRRIAETICKVKAQLQPPARPLANFLFVGPTGVGKTELAKTLARFLFGSSDRLVRFDMSEYMDPLGAERLIRGTRRDDGQLTRRVRQQPFCVILLDEIEKAHHSVFDLLLQVLGEGRLSDARGRTTHFHNAIIIMTSNLGAAHRRPATGFDAGPREESDPALRRAREEQHYLERVEEHFRPEFVNRVDRIIPFHSLDPDEIQRVTEIALAGIREREGLLDRGIELQIGNDMVRELGRRGYSETYGARASRRELEDALVSPVARALAAVSSRSEGATVRVTAPSDDPRAGPSIVRTELLEVKVEMRKARDDRRRLDDLRLIAQRRRLAGACMQLPPIAERRERMRQLVAELSFVGRPRRGGRGSTVPGAQVARLHADLAQIQGELASLDDLVEELESAEELAIAALYEGEPADLYRDEALAADGHFRRRLVETLCPAQPNEGVTLHLQDLDAQGAKRRYLAMVMASAEARGWRVEAHLQGERSPDWPSERPWGPPRDAAAMANALEDASARHLLVRVHGARTVAFLGRDEGRWRWASPKGPTELWLRVVRRSAAVADGDWLGEELAIEAVDKSALGGKPVREFTAQGELLARELADPLPLDPDDYFRRIEEVLFDSVVRRAREGE